MDELGDEILAPRDHEFVRVGEYYLGLEVLVALGRVHPRVVDEITVRFPQANDVMDSEVIAKYCKLAGRLS